MHDELLVTILLAYLLTLGTREGWGGLKVSTHGLHGGQARGGGLRAEVEYVQRRCAHMCSLDACS